MKELKKTLGIFIVFSIICGFIYTGVCTVIGQTIFKDKANGSMIEINGEVYGCELLGQQYEDENHMWGRVMNIDVSTFVDEEGNPLLYAGPTNQTVATDDYEQVIASRIEKLEKYNIVVEGKKIPVDLVTCSGSGLDPHISLNSALYQVPRIASNNNMSEAEVMNIIEKCTEHKLLGIFGEETVNVLKVNLMLEGLLK